MLSLDRCREILGPECRLAEPDLKRVREHLYALAEQGIKQYLKVMKRDREVKEDRPEESPS